ncbi:hypothetical protein HDU92_000277 [Lobulomyces angularis]|nr:hypothetical protein HDU92_000277 [Lobulomyces angularis]
MNTLEEGRLAIFTGFVLKAFEEYEQSLKKQQNVDLQFIIVTMFKKFVYQYFFEDNFPINEIENVSSSTCKDIMLKLMRSLQMHKATIKLFTIGIKMLERRHLSLVKKDKLIDNSTIEEKKFKEQSCIDTYLPIEILRLIMLSSSENMIDLLNFSLVNQRWSIISREILFESIEVDEENFLPLYLCLKMNAEYRNKTKDLHWFQPSTTEIYYRKVRDNLQFFPYDVSCCLITSRLNNLTYFDTWNTLNAKTLMTITSNCPNLKSLMLDTVDFSEFNVSLLNSNCLEVFKQLCNFRLFDATENFNLLEFFSNVKFSKLKTLKAAILKEGASIVWTPILLNISSLLIRFDAENSNPYYQKTSFLDFLGAKHYPNVSQLSLWGAIINADIFNLVSERFNCLNEIVLLNRVNLSDFKPILKKNQKLKIMNVDFNDTLNYEVFQFFQQHCSNLVHFTGEFFTVDTSLTGVDFENLFLKLKFLKTFYLSNDEALTEEIENAFKKYNIDNGS